MWDRWCRKSYLGKGFAFALVRVSEKPLAQNCYIPPIAYDKSAMDGAPGFGGGGS